MLPFRGVVGRLRDYMQKTSKNTWCVRFFENVNSGVGVYTCSQIHSHDILTYALGSSNSMKALFTVLKVMFINSPTRVCS